MLVERRWARAGRVRAADPARAGRAPRSPWGRARSSTPSPAYTRLRSTSSRSTMKKVDGSTPLMTTCSTGRWVAGLHQQSSFLGSSSCRGEAQAAARARHGEAATVSQPPSLASSSPCGPSVKDRQETLRRPGGGWVVEVIHWCTPGWILTWSSSSPAECGTSQVAQVMQQGAHQVHVTSRAGPDAIIRDPGWPGSRRWGSTASKGPDPMHRPEPGHIPAG